MRAFVEKHIAGDTLAMSGDDAISVPEYPASDGWTLKYRLTPQFSTPTQAPIELTAVTNADGERYDITAAPAVTALWKPGSYQWSRWVEKSGARQTLDHAVGQLDVLPDPAASAQGDDARSHARKMLEAIEAVLESRATSTQREMVAYTIGSRSIEFDKDESKADLLVLHSKYKWLVHDELARERIAAGQSNPRHIGIRFVR